MPPNTSEILSIKLNNFLHRIDSKSIILALASQHQCILKRIRRSKNWLLIGNKSQVMEMSLHLREHNIFWIADAIDKALPKVPVNLELFLKLNPSMTVNQLIQVAGCSLIEARYTIDKAEGLI